MRLHRYSLVLKLCLNRPPSINGFMLHLHWPEFVRARKLTGLQKSSEEVIDRVNCVLYKVEFKEKIFPGQEVEIIAPGNSIELEYEFDDGIYNIVHSVFEYRPVFLYWKIFFDDQMPIDGKTSLRDLNYY